MTDRSCVACEAAAITIKWMANSLSPSRVAGPLLEPVNKQAKALFIVYVQWSRTSLILFNYLFVSRHEVHSMNTQCSCAVLSVALPQDILFCASCA